jgi:5-methylcytosine-specific restriction endonuclease McrA
LKHGPRQVKTDAAVRVASQAKVPTATPVSRQVKYQSRRRRQYPASLEHQINLRDQRQCTQSDSTGKRCQEKRWLEFHHKIPIAMGGQDTLENLTTLCWAHHQLIHHKLTQQNNKLSQRKNMLSDQVREYVYNRTG